MPTSVLVPDVNVLVHAWHPGSTRHLDAAAWLQEASSGPRPLLLPDIVLSGAVRVLTNRRLPAMSAPVHDVLERVDELRHAPAATVAGSGTRHWDIFAGLCRRLDATGNLVPDCFIAAHALDRGATLVSTDRFFSRVPGLDWIDLPAAD